MEEFVPAPDNNTPSPQPKPQKKRPVHHKHRRNFVNRNPVARHGIFFGGAFLLFIGFIAYNALTQ